MDPLTPTMIAVLALAHETHERAKELPPVSGYTRHPLDCVAVWGTWQTAAKKLATEGLLHIMGVERGTREMEWQNLHGKHRRGKEGRLVHTYRLALRRDAVSLGARCAWAAPNLPKGRKYATWKDVPAELPGPRAGQRCPSCGCDPSHPCIIKLAGGCGEGSCVPAGVHNFDRCSACQLRKVA